MKYQLCRVGAANVKSIDANCNYVNEIHDIVTGTALLREKADCLQAIIWLLVDAALNSGLCIDCRCGISHAGRKTAELTADSSVGLLYWVYPTTLTKSGELIVIVG